MFLSSQSQITRRKHHQIIHQPKNYGIINPHKPSFDSGKVKAPKHMIIHIQANRNSHTHFQPSGSKQANILVLIPGKGPGSRIIFPPDSLIASADL